MLIESGIHWAEQGYLPDWLIRRGIRQLLTRRLRTLPQSRDVQGEELRRFVAALSHGPLAMSTHEANQQHYEVPAPFFAAVLGPYLKYSCGLWPHASDTLESSERHMLALTCERAQLQDGMRILDLGCGWGSLTRWILEHYPHCEVLAVSNSHPQRHFLEQKIPPEYASRVQVITSDINDFSPPDLHSFDRILSVEMLEHVRNYAAMLERMSQWIRENGRVFIHIFCHRTQPYFFEDQGPRDWMTRHFFTGGIMPCFDLLSQFPEHLQLISAWHVDGTHYARTSEAWLQRLDQQRPLVASLFRQARYAEPQVQLQRWRMFFLACAELFAFRGGQEWFVGHYLLQPRRIT